METSKTVPSIPPVAIVGMAGIFPEAANLKEFWKNIIHKRDTIKDVPSSRWEIEDYYDPDPNAPDKTYCKRGAFMPDTPFDPMEFGIPPNILEVTEVSQLLSLVVAKQALKDAGYDNASEEIRDRTGVILGVGTGQKLIRPLSSRLEYPLIEKVLVSSGIKPEEAATLSEKMRLSMAPWEENSFPGFLGNVIAGRIANRLDLGGPNCSTDAACASSLSALRLAIDELAMGRSDMMISGGVDTDNTIFMYMCFSKTPAFSKEGKIRPFDEASDGMLVGEAIGLVVLKRLEDALKDKDRIYCVIKGLGGSSDGRHKSIYAPRWEGQVKALERAYQEADFTPDTVDLIEAHGTGTLAGDIGEVTALKHLFNKYDASPASVALGSVKSQVGHTKSAAGATSLIKAALSLHHKVLPPTINVSKPSSKLELEGSPLYINTETRPWIRRDKSFPRRAGVSSFGFGGSNFHVALEEAPYNDTIGDKLHTPPDSLMLQAASVDELCELCRDYRQKLDADNADAFYNKWRTDSKTLTLVPDEPRLGIVAKNLDEARQHLTTAINRISDSATSEWSEPGLHFRSKTLAESAVLVFPQIDNSTPNSGRALALYYPEFIEVFESFEGQHTLPLSTLAFPIPVFTQDDRTRQQAALEPFSVALPVVSALQTALFKILSSMKLAVSGIIGEGAGELTALAAAGAFAEDDLARLCIELGGLRENPDQKIQERFIKSLKSLKLSQPQYPFYSSASDGPLESRKAIKPLLSKQIEDEPIGLKKNFGALYAKGERIFILAGMPPESLEKLSLSLTQSDVLTTALIEPNTEADDLRPFIESVTQLRVAGLALDSAPYSREQSSLDEKPKSPATVMLNGNNYLNPQREEQFKQSLQDGFKVSAAQPQPSTQSPPPMQTSQTSPSNEPDKTAALSPSQERILKSIEQSLDLLAQQQTQANETHQRFLEMQQDTQSSIYQTLQNQLALLSKESGIEIKAASLPTPSQPPQPSIPDSPPPKDEPHEPQSAPEPLQPSDTYIKETQPAPEPIATTPESSLSEETLVESMLEIVVEKTGYPKDMIELDMDMESDLGIDSIKRVQILSDMQERHPDLPVVDPAELGELKTLRQVVEHMRDQGESATDTPAADSSPVSESSLSEETLVESMLEIVVEKTGYPKDMIEFDMDMESDLGIDSIKRVQILSDMQERHPNLPVVDPVELGELKTLRQVVEHMREQGESDTNAPTADSSSAPESSLSEETLIESMLEIVVEKTGYPKDMIELDMDMESDLGIDSIKRVQILSDMQERHPDLPVVDPAELGELKTLRQVVDHMRKQGESDNSTDTENTSPQTAASDENTITRSIATLKPLPLPDALDFVFSEKDTLLVTYTGNPLTQTVIKKLNQRFPHITVLAYPKTGKRSIKWPEQSDVISLSNYEEKNLLSALEQINNQGKSIVGLVHVHNHFKMPSSGGPLAFSKQEQSIAQSLFLLAKHLKETLNRQELPRSFFSIVTQMDGQFGTSGELNQSPYTGGLFGLVKTLSREWEHVFCRAIDLAPEMDEDTGVQKIFDELCDPDRTLVEVAYSKSGRSGFDVQEAAIKDKTAPEDNENRVFLISGGARGVTAACACRLAEKYRCSFILVGRSDKDTPEPDWASGLTEIADLKQAYISAQTATGLKPKPQELEQALKQVQTRREIIATLEAIETSGGKVAYVNADIANYQDLKTKLKKVIKEMGSVTDIIHGAGVTFDKLIEQKKPEQIQTVLDTKIAGLSNLIRCVPLDKVNNLILFSSVAGFYGNLGQSDYAFANDVLNKIAYTLNQKYPNCATLAMDWGPWDGGMVDNDLREHFQKMGLPLIPLDYGAECLIDELEADSKVPLSLIGKAIG